MTTVLQFLEVVALLALQEIHVGMGRAGALFTEQDRVRRKGDLAQPPPMRPAERHEGGKILRGQHHFEMIVPAVDEVASDRTVLFGRTLQQFHVLVIRLQRQGPIRNEEPGRQFVLFSFARERVGNSSDARMPITAMTTSSSINVNPSVAGVARRVLTAISVLGGSSGRGTCPRWKPGSSAFRQIPSECWLRAGHPSRHRARPRLGRSTAWPSQTPGR